MNTSSARSPVPPQMPPARVRVAAPLRNRAQHEWPLRDWPAGPVEIPEGRQCFVIEWSGPAGSQLSVDGWDGAVSARFTVGTLNHPQWFPGTYAVTITLAGQVIWRGTFHVKEPQAKTQMAERLLEQVNKFVPGLSQPGFSLGIAIPGTIPAGGGYEDWAAYRRALASLRNIVANPLMDFQFDLSGETPGPTLTENIPENRWVAHIARRMGRRLLLARQLADQTVAQLDALKETAVSRPDAEELAKNLASAARHRETVTQLTRTSIRTVPRKWSPAGPMAPPSRARYARDYRQLGRSWRRLRVSPAQGASSPMARSRPTSELYELWLLAELLRVTVSQGWNIQEAPSWYRWGALTQPAVTMRSRFKFVQGDETLDLWYDRPFAMTSNALDTGAAHDVWLSAGHNRPDFVLIHRPKSRIPRAAVVEAKYRPRHTIWNPADPASTCWSQLQNYGAALRWHASYLHPTVLCLVPILEVEEDKPDPADDIWLVRADPLDLAAAHRQVLRREIARLTQERRPAQDVPDVQGQKEVTP